MSNMDNGPGWPEQLGQRPTGAALPQPGRPGAAAGGHTPSEPTKPKRGRKGKDKASVGTKTRVMGTQKILAIGMAIITAGLVFVVATAQESQTFVVRINAALPALSVVAPNQIEAVSLPDAAIEEGAISAVTAEEALKEALALIDTGRLRQDIPAGRQLHPGDISVEGQLTVPLAADERLVSINAEISAGVGGQLRAGDRVDVVALASVEEANTDDPRSGERITGTVARVIVRDVEIVSVLAAQTVFDAASQAQAGNPETNPGDILPDTPVPGVYVLRVSGENGTKLGLADSQADLFLMLRGGGATDPLEDSQPIALEDILGIPATATVAPETTPTAPVEGG